MNRDPATPFVLPPQREISVLQLLLERQRLRDRLGKALDTLRDLAENSGSEDEWKRLTAKAQGVSLAISYMDEDLR